VPTVGAVAAAVAATHRGGLAGDALWGWSVGPDLHAGGGREFLHLGPPRHPVDAVSTGAAVPAAARVTFADAMLAAACDARWVADGGCASAAARAVHVDAVIAAAVGHGGGGDVPPPLSPGDRCFADVAAVLPDELSAAWAAANVAPADTAAAAELLDGVRGAAGRLLDGTPWLGARSRSAARRKLDGARLRVGVDPGGARPTPADVAVAPGAAAYAAGLASAAAAAARGRLARLATPPAEARGGGRWRSPACVMDASHTPWTNTVTFNAVLQRWPVLPSAAAAAAAPAPAALAYGGAAFVGGLEFGHAFDPVGLGYDAAGVAVPGGWLSPAARAAFTNRTACVTALYDTRAAVGARRAARHRQWRRRAARGARRRVWRRRRRRRLCGRARSRRPRRGRGRLGRGYQPRARRRADRRAAVLGGHRPILGCQAVGRGAHAVPRRRRARAGGVSCAGGAVADAGACRRVWLPGRLDVPARRAVYRV